MAVQAHRFAAMTEADLDEVMEIETRAYPFPWKRVNFVDSLRAEGPSQDACCLRGEGSDLLGYFICMPVVDENHVLNVCVDPSHHGQGWGVRLLDEIVRRTRAQGMTGVLLEVRPSNSRALTIYERYGFRQIGCRRGYYPSYHGRREDAIVMRLTLEDRRAAA
ncbi:ribosomal protein S18-alanine N-acetyltransferase [Pandoraea sp.]|uniref:ribosomal protein S18-alanine N-acetyltransferase n=1 Tax=Pandoraea sp. TaxID=1883445 RepID=UPI00120A61DC|nr:ribosomal protein S18-alanine N-acetyltransferase [Pandoraea sp.]TAL52390.1 MAG: ribosomal-protein-alanine N-acetyltransferase [Pandoraea sp.]TAM16200.1 MAG: ribosomal-protein-alanine N-acetyltransferase [Pandoraea sp.]